MITLVGCPICNSNRFVHFRDVSGSSVAYENALGIRTVVPIITRYCLCQNCNLIFQNPRLSDTELEKFYSEGYYRNSSNTSEKVSNIRERDRAKIDAKIIKKFISNPTSHLDVGCGRGFLLKAIGASNTVGVESNVSYVKTKGVTVYPEMAQIPRRKFDLVTAIHVLEHVPYPLDFLKKMVWFVKKSGFLVIEVPSWKTQGGPLGFAHLFHFESEVLRLLGKQVGFEVMHTEFTPHLLLICRRS